MHTKLFKTITPKPFTRNAFFVVGSVLLLLFSFGRSASGQVVPNLPPPPLPVAPDPTPSSAPGRTSADDEVIRVTSNLISVPVSVTNVQGEPVQGLVVKDFRLEEEGRPREIAQIGDPDQVPVELALLVDVSGSTRGRFTFQREAATRFLKGVLRSSDRATIFAIDVRPRLEQTRTDANQAIAKLVGIEPTRQPTAFYDTVAEAARYLQNETPGRHRRVIVAISDGEDTYSQELQTIQAALAEVQRADAVFYSINPSGQALRLNIISRRGQNEMETLAGGTGGEAFIPEVIEDLDQVFGRIAAELRSQYLLGYYTRNEAKPGAFLRIKVTVPEKPELRIRARQGFYNPSR